MSEKNEDKEHKNLSDIFKKVLNTGISAAFMTEDAVKNILQDLPLPKEMVNGLLQNAKQTKTEFITSVKTELKDYLSKIDLSKEVDRIIEQYDIEVNAKIKLTPKNKTPKSSSKKK
jgi:hypothetical protein